MTPALELNKEELIAKWIVILLPILFLTEMSLSHWFIRKYVIGMTEIPDSFFLILHIIVALVLGFYLSSSRFFRKGGQPFLRYVIISLILSMIFGFLDGYLFVLFGACGPFAGPLSDCGFGPGEGDINIHGFANSIFLAFKWGIIFACALIVMLLVRWNTSFQKNTRIIERIKFDEFSSE